MDERKSNDVLALVLLAAIVIGFAWLSVKPQHPVPINNHVSSNLLVSKFGENEREDREQGARAAGAAWFASQRTYGIGYIPKDAEIRAAAEVRQRMIPELVAKGYRLRKSTAAQLHWEYLGPDNLGGRLRGLVVNPNDPNILYAGSVSGGVWKSTNAGASWFPTMNDLITLNISALEIKPGEPNTLYAGTGEAFLNADALPGRGIFKTTDGGGTWKRVHVAQGLNSPFISAIAVSPANPNVVYVAGRQATPRANFLAVETVPDSGVSAIFKSTDSGETWQDMTTGKGIEHDPSRKSDNFPADVVVSPADANVVYATFGMLYWGGGIWKSTDGGQTWSHLTNGLPDLNLPNMGYGRIKLAMAPSTPNVLYASFAYNYKPGDTIDLVPGAMLGLWKTINGGQSWTQVTTPLTINQRNRQDGHTTALGSQGDYANAIIVHPTDPNVIFVGGLDIYKSIDGGNTWSQVSMWFPPGHPDNPEGIPYVHQDHHVFAFDLSTNPPTLYNGSDGGVARSRDLGKTWEILNHDLGVTQFYTVAVHPTNPNIVLGGTQDNGLPMRLSGQSNSWNTIAPGDGWHSFFDYAEPTRIYVSKDHLIIGRLVVNYMTGNFVASEKLIGYTDGKNGITQRDRDKADYFAPYELSPNNPNVLVLGTNRLLKSSNRGDSWTPISTEFDTAFIAVAISEGNDNIIWAATPRQIYKTKDNGATYTSVTGAYLPKRFLTDIEFDPSNLNTVYLTYSGYGTPHVFKSIDAGGSWVNITNNLPDVPANTIQVHPQQPNLLFLGTDIGVFLSEDGGQTWQPCTNGFPTVQVAAIALNPNTNRIVAATHGRGVYSAELVSGGAAALNIEVAEISLQLQPGQTNSAAFKIFNGGNINLNFNITATGPLGTANDSSNTASLSGLMSGELSKLPRLDLATIQTEKGVTPVLRANAAPAQTVQAVPKAMAGSDVLMLDDGDDSADDFIGFGPGSTSNFYWANTFSFPEFGFRLESFDFYMRTESVSSNNVYVEVNDANGQALVQGNLDLATSSAGQWYTITLTNPLIFNAGSGFSIVVGASKTIGYPAGTDFDASVPNRSFYYDPSQNQYINLNTVSSFKNGAFLIRAAGTKIDRLRVNPASGTILPGGSQTITVTLNAQGLAEGDYQGQLNITSNGGNHVLPVRIRVSNTTGVDGHVAALPRAFRLEQNYPNPFSTNAAFGRPETSIKYQLPNRAQVDLVVYDLNGRRVAMVELGMKEAGEHVVGWDGRDDEGRRVASGVYFYRLEATTAAGVATTLTKKMTVMK